MGHAFARQRIPNEEEALQLNAEFESPQAIAKSSFFQLATGAGFSADSGLAVYKDIARIPAYEEKGLDYPTICDPRWVEADPSLFYGFWGACFNDYRRTVPHQGYQVIKNWRDMLFFKNEEFQKRLNERSEEVFAEIREKGLQNDGDCGITAFHSSDAELTVGPFYIYTSNVDNHSVKAGFKRTEVYEIHGNTEMWQCSGPCSKVLWRAPAQKDFLFNIDNMGFCDIEKTTNYRSTSALNTHDSENIESRSSSIQDDRFARNAVICPLCKRLARPAILMFGDFSCVDDEIPSLLSHHWEESVIETMASNQEFSVVVLEIGCGNNVTTVRSHSESFMSACAKRAPGRCTLIRVNPEFPLTDNTELRSKGINILSIMSKGLAAIRKIDEYLNRILSGSADNIEAEFNLDVKKSDESNEIVRDELEKDANELQKQGDK